MRIWVTYILDKVGRVLNFVQKNLRCRQSELKRNAFSTCVRLISSACPLCDPSETTLISQVENFQNRAAKYVLGRCCRTDSVPMLKQEFNWKSFSSRRQKLRLKLFFQIYFNKVGINRETCLKKPLYISKRDDHELKIHEYRLRMCMFANSFFPRCVAKWKKLSGEQVCCENEEYIL